MTSAYKPSRFLVSPIPVYKHRFLGCHATLPQRKVGALRDIANTAAKISGSLRNMVLNPCHVRIVEVYSPIRTEQAIVQQSIYCDNAMYIRLRLSYKHKGKKFILFISVYFVQ